MRCTEGFTAEILFSGDTLLLWVAVALAVLFLGVLVLDRVTRGKRRRRHPRRHENFGERLRNSFEQARALKGELKRMLQERARRRRGRGRRPPGGLR
jgi:hypothetical protein